MIRLGQKLREERIRKGFTLDDVVKATKIRFSFLSAIEKGDYKKLPSPAYAQGFVRNYCVFLGLPQKEMLALFRREFDEKKIYGVLPESFAKEEIPTKQFFLKPAVIVYLFFFLGLITYIFFQYKFAIINPPLSLSSPKNNQVFTTKEVEVSGETDSSVTVYVNNVPVSVDENGTFRKTISVFPGKEIITIKAVSRFGKETVIKRQIEVKPS
ncbi:MAG: helix-turn-helix domain-containing protein [Candidatus Levybacteria bacterium]|nr:helix-turn-helix domain-containing protein [Candidatus Levybacteria bacterium]